MSEEEMEISDVPEKIEASDEQTEETSNKDERKKVYLPNLSVEEGEELVCDQSAYIMYHQAQTSAPCLSFDIIKDNLGDNRETFPLTAYIVAGTQAPPSHVNHLIIMKLSNLHKTANNEENTGSDEDEEEDEDEDKSPKMHGALLKHQGCVNRIRVSILEKKLKVSVIIKSHVHENHF